MIVNPCKDCTERYVGCHSECEKYAEYRSQIEEKNRLIHEGRQELYGADVYEKKKSRRLKR